MTNKFEEISVDSLNENFFKLIGEKWMLITANDGESINTMTASWGGVGVLWNKNVTFCFIRPSRHTFKFMEGSDFYTLSFYDDKYKSKLSFCGTNSGKNVDKIKKIGFHPILDGCAPYFEESNLVLICRKIYAQYLAPELFLDDFIEQNYPLKDYHKMYIGEIEKVLVKNE
ncbi:MAG: flavin reductase [Clostridia bacterium]|nr:flavin reductase [Clostridia bacterium]